VLVGYPREFIEPAARERAQAIEMWFQSPKIIRLQISPQEVTQAAIFCVEILSGTIRCDVAGPAIGILPFAVSARCLR
jgi:hypothetical protein